MNPVMVRSTYGPGSKTATQPFFPPFSSFLTKQQKRSSLTSLTDKTRLRSRSLLIMSDVVSQSQNSWISYHCNPPLHPLCTFGPAQAWLGSGQTSCRSLSPLSPPLLSVLSGCHSSSSSPLHRPLYAALKAAHVQTLLGKAP